MKGCTLLIPEDIEAPFKYAERDTPLTLPELQAAVGGDAQVVPYLNAIKYGGETHTCHAFCNEGGKLLKLPINLRATSKWRDAQHHARLSSLIEDVLVGPVLVVWGDAAFMAEL